MSPSACRRLSVSWSRSKFKIFRHLIPNIKLVLEWENLVNIQPNVSGAFISSDEHFGLMILFIKKQTIFLHTFSQGSGKENMTEEKGEEMCKQNGLLPWKCTQRTWLFFRNIEIHIILIFAPKCGIYFCTILKQQCEIILEIILKLWRPCRLHF